MHEKKAVRASEDMRAVQCIVCRVVLSVRDRGYVGTCYCWFGGTQDSVSSASVGFKYLSQMLPYIKVHFL